MTCTLCKTGQLLPGVTTVTLERDGAVVVLKEVPARVCENCGNYQLDASVATQVLNTANEALAKGAEVEITRWRLAG
ncbi:type II toxin-antitoxin system MqsA family antitoxin [Hymenobacter sp. 102]|uniref:type II toxin-antitoxin system MqsA family antitoxin n=1 Tax=Hymenobacter sp. 102 TaxID=3403152 RepID=UPI003CF71A3B